MSERKPGRPPAPEDERRDERIHVRVSKIERKMIEQKARREYKHPATFLRDRGLAS